MKFILVSTAPKWQVTVYRKDDHTMISKNLTDFGASGMVAAFIVNKQSRKVEETKVTAVKYGDYKARRVRNGNFFIEYLPLDKYPTQIEEILYDFYRQPTNGGLPLLCAKPRKGLDWMTGLKNDDVKELLSTQKISTAVVSKSDFQPPAGLRKVASMQEVTMSDAKRAAAGEASELFDLK